MTEIESADVEDVLRVWYRWQIRLSHAEIRSHYYRGVDHTCRGYVTPTTEIEDDEDAYQGADDRQSVQVQLCIDQLSAEQRAAVSVSMLNKECGSRVWSSGRIHSAHAAYQSAKEALLPLLIKRGVLKIGATCSPKFSCV
ncbi:hypothetical protein [Burkholderia glumae]|uniref:hypothetical protein n=1 Tax=Burkholderia glumae TaxID=337 RepID=UPI002036841F|nr:hypothetical protein [Burkholderia glumae]MCM2543897.1 hypothetical protein [Burkholderia glumae]